MATDSKGTRKAKDGKSKEKKAKRAAEPGGPTKVERQAEKLARSLGESAQHVWLAGIGALGRAQSEGSRLFSSLVEEGEELEEHEDKEEGALGEILERLGRIEKDLADMKNGKGKETREVAKEDAKDLDKLASIYNN